MTDLELYFQFRCEKGLKERGLADNPVYQERLKHEIGIIRKMGFCGYFLVVSDYIKWAISVGIPVGPGRGSCVGSLVSYSMQITHLDPIKYGLFFERFLNPERVSPPDIDTDFCELRREEVISYIKEKYGEDKVAHIGTFGTLKAKSAIRDVARALGYDYNVGDRLAKLTLEPIEGKPQPLSVCYEKVPELKTYRSQNNTDEQKILVWAEKIENRLRSFGTHASGVVISDVPISYRIPLYPSKDGVAATQFEMNTVEEVGLIKFDLLGLRALTTIKRCTNLIKEHYSKDINPLEIPVDDDAVYLQLQQGDVAGVFQLEGSSGIRDILVQIKPKNLEDLATLVALYRPGPLGSDMLQQYLKIRMGQAEPTFLHEDLRPILGPTDGMLIFQEQILEICRNLAGYSLAEADLMRRAVGKKKEKEMKAQELKFKKGLKKNGYDEELANSLWKDIDFFSAYGFNKSHAVAYAYISYQMAWLKHYYPVEFMCACLVSDSDEVDKIIKYIGYCKRMEIPILPPDINESDSSFSVVGKGIRFGLSAIKNLGQSPAGDIIKERDTNGPYKDLLDFAARVDISKINRTKLESLVLCGAFDNTATTGRSSLIGAVEDILRHKKEQKQYESKMATFLKKQGEYEKRNAEIREWSPLNGTKQLKPFKKPVAPIPPEPPKIPNIPDLSSIELLAQEKELLGFFISGHPLDNVSEQGKTTISKLKEKSFDGEITSIIAVPSVRKEITTKKSKQKMSYMVLEDQSGTIDAVILPSPYSEFKHLLDTNTPAEYNVTVDVTENDENRIVKLRINSISMLKSIRLSKTKPMVLNIRLSNAKETAKLLALHQGKGQKIDLYVESETSSTKWFIGRFDYSGSKQVLLTTAYGDTK